MKKKILAGLVAAGLLCATATGCSKTIDSDNRIKDLFNPYDRGDNIAGENYSDQDVTVDGDLSENIWKNAVWNDMKSEPANRDSGNSKYELEDCNISATAIVRENGLLVGIKSTDKVAYAGKILQVNNKALLSAFAQTGVSIYFCDSADTVTGGRPCYEIGFSAAGSIRCYYRDANITSEMILSQASVKSKIDGQVNSSDNNGYSIEAFIPWSDLQGIGDGEIESVMATFASHRHPEFDISGAYDGKKLTFEMLEVQQGAGWLAPLTWKEYGESGKKLVGMTSSDKYGDYDDTLKSNAIVVYPKNNVFANATNGQKYVYVKDVKGKNLYAEATISNASVNWGMAGFAFRDVLTPPTYEPESEGSNRQRETDKGAVWAGLRYGGAEKSNHLYCISTDLTDTGDVSKAGNTYVIGTPETYDDSKGATGVKIGTYISENGTVLLYVNGELKKVGYAKHLSGKDMCVSFAGRDMSCLYGDITVLSGEQAFEKIKDDLAAIESDVYGDYSAEITADASAVYGSNGDLSLNKTQSQQYLYFKNIHGNKLYAKATISNVDTNWGVIGFAFRDVTDLTKTAWMGLRYGGAEKSNHLYAISANLSDVGNTSLAGNYSAQGTEQTFDNSKGTAGVTVEVMIDSDGTALIAIDGVVKRYVTLDFMVGKDMIAAIAGRDSGAQYKNVQVLAGEQASAKITAYKSSVISDVYGDYNANIAADARAIYGQNGEVNLAKTSGQQYLYVKNIHGNKLYAKATISNVDTNWGMIGFAFRDATDLSKSVWAGLRYGGAEKGQHLYMISAKLADVGDINGNHYVIGKPATYDNSKGSTGVTIEAYIDETGLVALFVDGELALNVRLAEFAGKDMIVSFAARDCAATYKDITVKEGTQAFDAFNDSAKVKGATFSATNIDGLYQNGIDLSRDVIGATNPSVEITVPSNGQRYAMYNNAIDSNKVFAQYTIKSLGTATANKWGAVSLAFVNADGNGTYYGLKYEQNESTATNLAAIVSYRTENNEIVSWSDNGKDANNMTYANAGFPADGGLLDKLNADGLTFTVYCDGTKYHYFLNGVPIAGWHGSYTRSLISNDQNFQAVGTSNIVKALIVVENAHVNFSDYKIVSGDAAATSYDDFLESAGGGKYGDYNATLKADAIAVTNADNDVCLVKTSNTQYSYFKSVKSDTLYVEARISNVNVNWGAVGFAFRDVDAPDSVAFSTLRYGGNAVAEFFYTVATNAADVCADVNHAYKSAGTEADLQATYGKDKSKGVLLQAYVDNAGNVSVAVNGVVKATRNVAALAGKQLCAALFGGNAGCVYKNVSVKTGADATVAFNALTQA